MRREDDGRKYFSLLITPMLREIVIHILAMCDFQDNLSSTVIPRNFILETLSKGVSSKTTSDGKSLTVLLNIIYFVFWRFSESLFALIHSVSLISSELTVSKRVFGLSWEKKTFESSAKSIKERI